MHKYQELLLEYIHGQVQIQVYPGTPYPKEMYV